MRTKLSKDQRGASELHSYARVTSPSRAGWLPRSVEIGGGTTAAQRASAVARLEQIERILQRTPELANPQGFEIEPVFYGGARRLGPGKAEHKEYVVEYTYTLIFYVPTKAIAHEGCACIDIRVNPVSDVDEGGITDKNGREIFVEMNRGEPIPLATRVYGKLSATEPGSVSALLTPGKVFPLRQVSREEYYNAWILEIEGKNGANTAEFRSTLAKSRYQEWMAGMPQRKKEREDLLKSLAAAQSPAEVAKMRKVLEETEQEVTQQLKVSDASDRAEQDTALARIDDRPGAMRRELDTMSRAERQAPALLGVDVQSGGFVATGRPMLDRDGPGVWRALTSDYDYWRARSSPVEARAIQVNIGVGGSGKAPPVQRALLQAFTTLDCSALHWLLAPPS